MVDCAEIFHIDLFNCKAGWTALYADDRYRQRYQLVAGRIFCETVVHLRADVKLVRSCVQGPWDWWQHGQYKNRREQADGTVQYELCPPSRFIYVQQTMYPPVLLEGGGWRIKIDMVGAMKGLVYFEIRPQGDLGSALCGRFAGVEVNAGIPKLLGLKRSAIAHLASERGALTFPFRKGTGYVGLIKRLEVSE